MIINKIDSHQHFWKYNEKDYPWLSGKLDKLRQDFLPDDLKKELDRHGFSGSVAVQARQSLEETRWLLSLSEKYDFIRAVVGWINLRSERVEEELFEFTGHRKFAGVRHVLQDEKIIDFMLGKEFLRGINYLMEYGLTYDLLIYPIHLNNAIKVVRKFTDMKFVVDHLAKPSIRDGTLEPWSKEIKQLADCDHVFCKLSGMVTEADWEKWKPADFTPFMDVILEAFGPGRIMLGSDWPVCLAAAHYGTVVELVTDYIKKLSDNEQRMILRDNCLNFYSMGPD